MTTNSPLTISPVMFSGTAGLVLSSKMGARSLSWHLGEGYRVCGLEAGSRRLAEPAAVDRVGARKRRPPINRSVV
ncbi:MAG: hypothetical protein MUC41_18590, partial [Syntrophobacteraceae bacterium]|nr:hypothetical protein [Syntrophobacteraceae bacterium]